MNRLIALCVLLALSACATFTPPAEKPIIKHDVGIRWSGNKFETLAATADRRIILISPDNNRVCAEPSPDAITSLASTISATLSANKDETAEIRSAIARGLAQNSRAIAHRTQGLAFYRDMAFQACQLWMNDVVNSDGYINLLVQAANLAAPLIDKEIDLIPLITKAPPPEAATAPKPDPLPFPDSDKDN